MDTIFVQSKYSKEATKFEVRDPGDSYTYYYYWEPPYQGLVLRKDEYVPCDRPAK